MLRNRAASLFLLGLSCVGFVSLGLPDGVLGVAWPSIRTSFGLPLDALGALLVTSSLGYVGSSFSSGPLLARMSVGALLAASCVATAVSLLGYAYAPAWWMMVVLGALAGLGAGAIDAGINTYVATHHSARTLNLLHAFYGLGTTSGPIIMTSVLMAGMGWQSGYRIIGLAQLALALCFGATQRLWPGPNRSATAASPAAPIHATLRLRAAHLSLVTFFLYVGIESTAGAWIYSLLYGARGETMAAAGTAVSVYWGGLMVGRLFFGLVPTRTSPSRLVRYCVVSAAAAAGALALGITHSMDFVAAASLGFAAGPIFPCLIATTPQRFPEAHAANAVGLQVAAAALGQSILPASVGVLADSFGLETIPIAVLSAALLLLAVYETLQAVAPAGGCAEVVAEIAPVNAG
jgi:fucose permease